MNAPRRAAAFLDRDGVVVDEVGYLSRAADVRLSTGAAAAIRRLNEREVPVVVVTNQAGVARGKFAEAAIAEVHATIDRLLAAACARIDRYYYCPHHPEASVERYRIACACRKPMPGMLEQAARELELDLPRSWLVGDKLSDLEAAAQAGAQAILVRSGYGRETERALEPARALARAVADDLPAAVEIMFADWFSAQPPIAAGRAGRD
ncbi:MAG: HAD-IIIA family hydrolase [Pirellulales bacterium]|nr:HAD-IIIA family hydrolase [Pirellulales bacterium]